MLTRSLADWRSQYDRTQRSYARLQKAVPSSGYSSVAYDDDVLHFFLDCWHLKDWIKNDTNLPSALKDSIARDVHAQAILQIARKLVNGWKHCAAVGVDVTDVARNSVDAWDTILRKHGLL